VTERALALVDGEHYPPVVRAAIAAAGRDDQVVEKGVKKSRRGRNI